LIIKAINASFLKGAPHLNVQAVPKYLMPSLAAPRTWLEVGSTVEITSSLASSPASERL
jgi:hypothetical protein